MRLFQHSLKSKIFGIFSGSVLAFLLLDPTTICRAQATSTVSGKVTDSSNGQPIPFATVFLANTLIGTRTAEDGTWKLNGIPPGKYELTISNVGYKMKRGSLSITADRPDLNVALEPEIKVLNTVVVKSSNAEYLKNLRLFKRYFLGGTRNATKCTIVNIDAVNVWFDHESNTLHATSEDPIEIENEALGYRVYYFLQEFMVDFNAHIFTMAGVPRFQELYNDADKQYRVVKERDRAYYGSLNHFMRSLRTDKLARNKFDLYIWRRQYYRRTGGLTHSTQYGYYPLDTWTMRHIRPDSLLKLKIVYNGASPEPAYDRKAFNNGMPQISSFTYLKHGLVIHENGYYDDPKAFFLESYMGWRENVIGELLPFDYQPVLTLKEKKLGDKLEREDSIRRSRQKQLEIE